MLKPGWLKRQVKKAKQDMETWPKWMKRTPEEIDAERNQYIKEGHGRSGSLGIDPDNHLSIHQ